MADMIKFFKGQLASLPSSGVRGALYVTTDEGAIYLGTGTGMKRLGDFIQVADVGSLPTQANESSLYYCVEENILAKWNGTDWTQINKQPTAEELKTLLGLGSLAYLSQISESNLDNALKEKVNAAAEGNHSHLNKDVLDGISAEDIADWDAATKVEASTTNGSIKIDGVETVVYTHPAAHTIAEVTGLQDELDSKLEAADIANKVDKVTGKSLVLDTEITKLAGVSANAKNVAASETNGNIKIDGVETVVYTHPAAHTISEVTGLQDELDSKLEEADIANKADKATTLAGYGITDAYTQTQVDDLVNAKVASVTAGDASVTIGGTATAPTVAAKISADADNAIELASDGLKVVIPTAAEYSIVKAANSGDYAAVYNLTKDGTIVGASINIPKDLVVKSGSVVDDEIVLILNDEAETEIRIDVASLIEYVTSGSAAGDMVVINVSDDHKVTATITDGTITAAKLTTELQTKINQAHTHSNATVLDGITAAKVADWDDAVSKEHTHANKALLDTYAQTEANLADAVAKKHAHANADVLAGITAAKVAAWDAAEQNAKDYADDLLTWGEF